MSGKLDPDSAPTAVHAGAGHRRGGVKPGATVRSLRGRRAVLRRDGEGIGFRHGASWKLVQAYGWKSHPVSALANVYLHAFDTEFTRMGVGELVRKLVRCADDGVVLCRPAAHERAAGQAQPTEEWFSGYGLHRLRGTIRYPKAA